MIENFINSLGGPVRFEEYRITQNIIVLKMKEDSNIMEVLTQYQRIFGILDTVPFTNLQIILPGDGVAIVVFQRLADHGPFAGDGAADMLTSGNMKFDGVRTE